MKCALDNYKTLFRNNHSLKVGILLVFLIISANVQNHKISNQPVKLGKNMEYAPGWPNQMKLSLINYIKTILYYQKNWTDLFGFK